MHRTLTILKNGYKVTLARQGQVCYLILRFAHTKLTYATSNKIYSRVFKL